jgi:O-antigen/teichoic acid export membrane protein
MPGMAFSGLFYVAQSLIHVKGKTHITGSAVALFSISSVVMNYFLIQIWGMAGLLLVYNLVWISMALLLMKLGLKEFPVALEKKRLAVIAFTFVLFLSLIYLLHDTSSYLFYSIIPLLFLITIYSYYNGGFFDSREKFIIKDLLNKIISRFHLLRSSTNLNSQQNT